MSALPLRRRPILRVLPRPSGLLLASATGGGGGGGFSIPTPPTPSTGSSAPLAPNFTAGPIGKDETRPWIAAVVDGVPCFANGWDQPWRWDEGANFFPLGSTAPTTFAVADAAGGSTFAAGTVLVYYLVFAVSSLGKETSPQLTAGVAGVTHTMVGTKDAAITWVDPGGEYNVARIYRRLQGTDDFKLVAQVTASTATYTDASADSALATATTYVRTFRATLPPIFRGLFEHLSRLWGFTGEDPTLYYAQTARTDGRFVADDWPDANLLPLEPNDGCGAIKGAWSHNAFLYAFKERASYQVEGDDPSNFVVTRMYAGRGCLSMRAMAEIDDGNLIILDALGPYRWTPGGQPVPVGVTAGGISKFAPIWARMNLGAADSFYVVHDRAQDCLVFYIALDHDPVPSPLVLYYYKKDILLSDPYLWGCAGGLLEDATGHLHLCRVDDLGILWEDGVGNSDGVYAGSTTGTLTAGTALLWTCGAASFDTTTALGGVGSLARRYSTAGAVIDTNRIAALTSTTITPLLFSATTPAATQTCAIGVIPAVAQGGKNAMGSDLMKHVTSVVLEHEIEASSSYTLNFMSAADSDTLARPPVLTSVNLSANEGRSPVSVSDRGWLWAWQVSQEYAGVQFALRSISVHFDYLGTPR